MNDVNALQKLGFRDREARILAELMKNMWMTVDEIANRTGIKRPHVYVILNDLQRRGFIVKSAERPSKYALNPDLELFKKLAVRKIEEINESIETLAKTLSSRRLKSGMAMYSDAQLFIKNLLDHLNRVSMRAWASVPTPLVLDINLPKLLRNLALKGIEVRLIIGDFDYFKNRHHDYRFLRYVEPLPPFILFFLDDTVYLGLIYNSRVVYGFIVYDEKLVKNLEKYFEHIWSEDYAKTLYRVKARYPKPY